MLLAITPEHSSALQVLHGHDGPHWKGRNFVSAMSFSEEAHFMCQEK
jgi:hypothetical protein